MSAKGAQQRKPLRTPTTATIACEAEVWRMHHALRGSTEPAGQKHIVLEITCFNYMYMSEPFQEHRAGSCRARRVPPRDPERAKRPSRLLGSPPKTDAIRSRPTAASFPCDTW